jgi:hypothetical protein
VSIGDRQVSFTAERPVYAASLKYCIVIIYERNFATSAKLTVTSIEENLMRVGMTKREKEEKGR